VGHGRLDVLYTSIGCVFARGRIIIVEIRRTVIVISGCFCQKRIMAYSMSSGRDMVSGV
jgi:hypothetical protein